MITHVRRALHSAYESLSPTNKYTKAKKYRQTSFAADNAALLLLQPDKCEHVGEEISPFFVQLNWEFLTPFFPLQTPSPSLSH